jgi:phage gp36-like protein
MYVTPDDMRSLFEYEDLVKATNLDDPNASEINKPRLDQACEAATGVVDGWLLRRLSLPLSAGDAALLNVLRSHTAILAMEWLGGADDILIAKAKDSREWLKAFTDPSVTSNEITLSDPNDLSVESGFAIGYGGSGLCPRDYCTPRDRAADLFGYCY